MIGRSLTFTTVLRWCLLLEVPGALRGGPKFATRFSTSLFSKPLTTRYSFLMTCTGLARNALPVRVDTREQFLMIGAMGPSLLSYI